MGWMKTVIIVMFQNPSKASIEKKNNRTFYASPKKYLRLSL